jgi:hypothetical protein
MSNFQYTNQGFSFYEHCPKLVQLFTEFVENKLIEIQKKINEITTNNENKFNSPEYITLENKFHSLQIVMGAFPELNNNNNNNNKVYAYKSAFKTFNRNFNIFDDKISIKKSLTKLNNKIVNGNQCLAKLFTEFVQKNLEKTLNLSKNQLHSLEIVMGAFPELNLNKEKSSLYQNIFNFYNQYYSNIKQEGGFKKRKQVHKKKSKKFKKSKKTRKSKKLN